MAICSCQQLLDPRQFLCSSSRVGVVRQHLIHENIVKYSKSSKCFPIILSKLRYFSSDRSPSIEDTRPRSRVLRDNSSLSSATNSYRARGRTIAITALFIPLLQFHQRLFLLEFRCLLLSQLLAIAALVVADCPINFQELDANLILAVFGELECVSGAQLRQLDHEPH